MNTVTHQTSVKPTIGRPRLYVACCNCGWQGAKCWTPKDAQKWADNHERTGR